MYNTFFFLYWGHFTFSKCSIVCGFIHAYWIKRNVIADIYRGHQQSSKFYANCRNCCQVQLAILNSIFLSALLVISRLAISRLVSKRVDSHRATETSAVLSCLKIPWSLLLFSSSVPGLTACPPAGMVQGG